MEVSLLEELCLTDPEELWKVPQGPDFKQEFLPPGRGQGQLGPGPFGGKADSSRAGDNQEMLAGGSWVWRSYAERRSQRNAGPWPHAELQYPHKEVPGFYREAGDGKPPLPISCLLLQKLCGVTVLAVT